MLFLLIMVTFFAFAQQPSYIDIIELKNGSIIKGIIIEQIPNEQIKIKLLGGSVFVYKMDEILKIKKEFKKKSFVSTHDKGYIGISLGLSIPSMTNSEIPNGATLSLIDLGYISNSNIGLAIKWMGSAYSNNNSKLSVGNLMFGILTIAPINNQIDFCARGLLGFSKMEFENDDTIKYSDYVEFSYNLGVGLKFNIGRKIALLTNVDYLIIKELNSLNITGGIGYRF